MLRTPPAAAGLFDAQEIVLDTADGEKVIVWYVPPKPGKPLVLYFHGNGGSLRYRADRFRALAERWHRPRCAELSRLRRLDRQPVRGGFDRRRAKQPMRLPPRAMPPQRIVVFGESLGSGVAVALAATHRIGGLVLEAPFTSAADIGAAAYWFLPVRLLMKDPFRSDQRIGKVTAPLLVLHGARDGVVPIAHRRAAVFACERAQALRAHLPRAPTAISTSMARWRRCGRSSAKPALKRRDTLAPPTFLP